MGIRARPSGSGVRKFPRPRRKLLGGVEGKGFKVALRPWTAAGSDCRQAVGIAPGPSTRRVRYVRSACVRQAHRRLKNTPFKLAEMNPGGRRPPHEPRAAVAKTTRRVRRYAAMAKLMAPRVANDVTRGASRLMGGSGYARNTASSADARRQITEITKAPRSD